MLGTSQLIEAINYYIIENNVHSVTAAELNYILLNMTETLGNETYDSLRPYSVGETIVYDNSGSLGSYVCIIATLPGENPITNPAKWAQLSTASDKSVIVSLGFSSVPGTIVENAVYYCTNSFSTYTEGSLYRGQAGVLNEITLLDGQPITFAIQITSTNNLIVLDDGSFYNTFDVSHIYIWNSGVGKYYDNGSISILRFIIDKTHAELTTLKSGSQLIPGQKYKITDFKTKYNQDVTNTVKTAASFETLILTATSINTFDEIVQSIEFPKDFLKYDFDDILCEDATTARKGKITHRTTSDNNTTAYDSRTVLFDRTGDVLTFGTGCHDICIEKDSSGNTNYNDTIFGSDCYNIHLGFNCWSNTFGTGNYGFIFGDNNYSLAFGNDNYSLTFRNSNSNFTFGDYNNYLTFGDSNISSTFGNENNSLTFGNGNNSFTFGDDNNSLTFGDANSYLTFGNGNSSLTFGDGNSYLTFGDSNISSTFGNVNNSLTFGDYNSSLTFGDSNDSLNLGNENSSLTFGDSNNSLTLGNGNSHSTFGDSNDSLNLGNGNSSLIFENGNSYLSTTVVWSNVSVSNNIDFTGIDFTSATLVSTTYHKTIYTDTVGTKLTYFDAALGQVIANIND
jgi:hypothetical protein